MVCNLKEDNQNRFLKVWTRFIAIKRNFQKAVSKSIDVLQIKYCAQRGTSVLLPHKPEEALAQVRSLEKPHLPQPRVIQGSGPPPRPILGEPGS